MLCRLSSTNLAAWCDACLRGSEVIRYSAPGIARFYAIDRLAALGWLHVPAEGLAPAARADAEREWTGATYCVDCAADGLRQPTLFDLGEPGRGRASPPRPPTRPSAAPARSFARRH